MANLYMLLTGTDASLKYVALGGLGVLFYVAILLYILYNSSILPRVALYRFGQPVFRSSKERRKARLREARASKCSSGDSGDSGIEIVGSSGVLNPSDLFTDGHFTQNSVFHVSVDDPACPSSSAAPPLTGIKVIGNGGSSSSSQHHHTDLQQPQQQPSCDDVYRASCDGYSRHSLASSSISSSSQLDSTNTSVTTISCYGNHVTSSSAVPPTSLTTAAPELSQDGSSCCTNSTCSSSSAAPPPPPPMLAGSRNSFHISPPFSHPVSGTNFCGATKIRRCQSDVAPSNNISKGTAVPLVGGSCRGVQHRDHCHSVKSSNIPAVHRHTSIDGDSLSSSKSLKRSQGSTHLRRSVSQPLDLNKSQLEGSVPGPGGAGPALGAVPHRRPHRRPSTGNLLAEEHTTSEEDMNASDSEEHRRDRDVDLCGVVVYAEALWDHVTLDSEELVFQAGDLLTVEDRTDHDWWWGRLGHRGGWFPVAFVRLLVNQEEVVSGSQELQCREQESCEAAQQHEEDCDIMNTSLHLADQVLDTSTRGCALSRAVSVYSSSATPRKASVSGLSHDTVRANVIREIITTERDFVKHLRDVVEGYLHQARRRPDMFTVARISAIFGNMEELYAFQKDFLGNLESCINWDILHQSCIGEAFIKNSDKFEIYSEYCNNHPFAVSELQELYQYEKYVHFFEACRLLQEMIDISLDGFLLTPVQKICKYPLQLQELLKYTKPDHPDYICVEGALNAMRSAALLVNERRRRMECLEKIAAWQMALEGWEGAELLECSSQLIHQGEVIKGAGGSWPKEVTLFLFDRQLVYCKKDIIKRNTYVYRGRINLDHCSVQDIIETKDCSGGKSSGVANAWRIHCRDKNKSYVFACKTTVEKTKWLEALRRERELVAGDEEAGFLVSNKTRQLAKEVARTRRSRPKKPRTSKVQKRSQALTHAQAELLVNIDKELRSNSLPSHQQQQQQQQLSNTAPLATDVSDSKKRGLWFSFGGQKKSRSQTRTNDSLQQPTAV